MASWLEILYHRIQAASSCTTSFLHHTSPDWRTEHTPLSNERPLNVPVQTLRGLSFFEHDIRGMFNPYNGVKGYHH